MIVVIGSVVNMRGTFFVFIMILVRHRATGIDVEAFRDGCLIVVGVFSTIVVRMLGCVCMFVVVVILVRHRAAGINVKVFRDVRVIIMIMVCGFVVGMFSSVGMDLIGGVIVGV